MQSSRSLITLMFIREYENVSTVESLSDFKSALCNISNIVSGAVTTEDFMHAVKVSEYFMAFNGINVICYTLQTSLVFVYNKISLLKNEICLA